MGYQQQTVARQDTSHAIIHFIGDNIGWLPLLVILLVGIGVMFKKKIKQWLGD